MKRILILVALSLLLCSTASAFQDGGGKSTKNPKPTPTPKAPSEPKPKVEPHKRSSTPPSGASESRDIRITLSDLSGTAKFFDYKLSNNKPVRFFVMKCSDGVYRAAMDACDTCYHAKKGYHQEGDDMICNNCGLHFHSSQINDVLGGCNPVGLPRTIEGNQLVIKSRELESRGKYF